MFIALVILVNLVSIGFMALSLQRTFVYIKKFDLPESRYTLLFRIIKLRHVVFGYVVVVGLSAVASFYLALKLL